MKRSAPGAAARAAWSPASRRLSCPSSSRASHWTALPAQLGPASSPRRECRRLPRRPAVRGQTLLSVFSAGSRGAGIARHRRRRPPEERDLSTRCERSRIRRFSGLSRATVSTASSEAPPRVYPAGRNCAPFSVLHRSAHSTVARRSAGCWSAPGAPGREAEPVLEPREDLAGGRTSPRRRQLNRERSSRRAQICATIPRSGRSENADAPAARCAAQIRTVPAHAGLSARAHADPAPEAGERARPIRPRRRGPRGSWPEFSRSPCSARAPSRARGRPPSCARSYREG